MPASIQNEADFTDFEPPVPSSALPLELTVTIPATALDSAGDRYNLRSILAGKKLVRIDLLSNGVGDGHATPTLDGDLVLSYDGLPTESGTETVLFDGGTRFQSASAVLAITDLDDLEVSDSVDGKAVLRWRTNTGAATPQAFALHFILWIRP